MEIHIKDKTITLHYTMRSLIIYENITGESFTIDAANSVKSITTLLLSVILGSAQKDKIDLQLTYDEYIDWLDENGCEKMIDQFGTWLANELASKASLMVEEEEKEEDFPEQGKKARH